MAIQNSRSLMRTSAAGQGNPGVVSTLALQVLLNPRIQLARSHVSGVHDHATARHNAVHQLFELLAKRSQYQNAPGGMVSLDVRMLRALIELARLYRFSISELAGGRHSRRSEHYLGLAFDVNVINGTRISTHHQDVGHFMEDCKQLGATEVIGPPSRGHETHVHAAWPFTHEDPALNRFDREFGLEKLSRTV